MTRTVLILTVMAALAACDHPDAPASRPKAAPPPTPMSVAKAPARPSEPGAIVPALSGERMQEAASVSQLHAMPRLNAKVFSVSGGDPAVNGLVTYLALFAGSAEGWRVYPLGDFAAWRVVEAMPGRIVLATVEDKAGPAGDIVKKQGHVHVAFAAGGQTPPDTISVALTNGRNLVNPGTDR